MQTTLCRFTENVQVQLWKKEKKETWKVAEADGDVRAECDSC